MLDDQENQVLQVRLGPVPPRATLSLDVGFELELGDGPMPADEPLRPAFLRSEPYIESDHPEIQRLAHRLRRKSAVDTAREIFRWVTENVQLGGYIREERGALYALRQRKGDCTEGMDLFVALARANGIPARGIGGYVMLSDGTLKSGSYHNWAEFYADGAWRIADPQGGRFMERGSECIAMQVLGEGRSGNGGRDRRFWVSGEGLEVRMN